MPEAVMQPWPWYVAGPLIGLVVPFVYWYGGRKWGVSSTLQQLLAGNRPGRIEYFHYEWWKRGARQLAMAQRTRKVPAGTHLTEADRRECQRFLACRADENQDTHVSDAMRCAPAARR